MRPRPNRTGISYDPIKNVLTVKKAKYEVLGFRNPDKGELFLEWDALLFWCNNDFRTLVFLDTATARNVRIRKCKHDRSESEDEFSFFQVLKKIIPKRR